MPPYYDVHKGATDPKTTAEKHCLQQLRPPSRARNPVLALQATSARTNK